MGRMSNRERIARAAEEARLGEEEKSAKKKSAGGARRAAAAKTEAGARLKIVWAVCDQAGSVVKTFPYPAKAEAEAEVKKRSEKSGRPHMLRADKVPMD